MRPIARGGMAEVFLARRRGAAGVEKRLVIKRIRPERAGDPRLLELFVREARLSMGLVHANIVPVFDFGRVGEDLFLAMEFVDGRDLDAAMQRARERGHPLAPVLLAHIGAEACQALHYAHTRKDEQGRSLGLVHRDVTPRNVLLSFSGEVKLVDFGVASLAADAETGRVRGTPAYMSPEQARGEPIDGRSDLFSLGLVLWAALADARAYPGPDATALLADARAGVVPPLPGSVPEPLRRAMERATRPRPEDRFAGALAMQHALEAFVVAERSAHPDLSPPSHQLADWLRSLFPAEDEAEPIPPGDGDGRQVTFLDDGEEAVRQARSLAETVGDEPPPPRRAWLWAAIGAAIIAGSMAALVPADRRIAAPPADAATVAIAAPPPHPSAQPVPDAAPPPAPVPPRKQGRVTLHRVSINARPWAQVYIDGKYADETPFRASLPAGSHRLRFVNPQDGSSKEITITVPRSEPVIEVLSP